MNGSNKPAAKVVDVGSQRVARVYAEALLNAAERRQQAQEVLEELDALIEDIFARDPHYELFISSGAIGRDRKEALLRGAFEGRGSEVFTDFLLVLNKHDRLELLRPLRAAYRELFDQRARRLRVQVRSAVPLPDDQAEHLRNDLRETFHQEPVLETQVDPELLGGIVVRVGDWLYDGSVRTRLQLIRNQIIERSSHEIQSRRNRFRTTNGN